MRHEAIPAKPAKLIFSFRNFDALIPSFPLFPFPQIKSTDLPLNFSSKKCYNGNTIVSPSRSFKSVMKALNKVGIFSLCTSNERY